MKFTRIGRASAICALVFAVVATAIPASAQSSQIKGRVMGADNKPVEGASVVIQSADTPRKYSTQTDRRGDYVQVGLQPGQYTVTATKGDLTQTYPVKLGLEQKEVNFLLKPGGGAAGSPEDAKKEAARIEGIKTTFAEGAALTNEGKYDEAIAKFNAVLEQLPKCFDCYNNLGTVYSRKQDWVKAEESFKKAIELNANSADAYNGLANAYNAQKKFKEAQEASNQATKLMTAPGATGGGNPQGLYNAAVIAWNANDFAKAHELLAAAIKADEKHAESHFMLGRVLINLGKLGEAATEFETYLKLSPSGPNAKEAQANFDALKTYRK